MLMYTRFNAVTLGHLHLDIVFKYVLESLATKGVCMCPEMCASVQNLNGKEERKIGVRAGSYTHLHRLASGVLSSSE